MTTKSTSRIPIPTKENAPAESKPILENYEKVLGATPNFFSLISLSPDILKAITNMQATLGKSLGHKTRERIHIATAEVNGCDVNALTAVGFDRRAAVAIAMAVAGKTLVNTVAHLSQVEIDARFKPMPTL
ncbi:MAG: hypothetical protein WAM44_09665 [Chthoniobacterales bacterium]